MRAGYNNRWCLEKLSEEGLAKVVPKKLAGRIKRRFSGENSKVKERGLQNDSRRLTTISSCTSQLKTENRELKTVLQIDTHRPDRIIFEGKEVKVTATEFSLIHLLAQHNEQVMSYNELVVELWGDNENAIYSRVSYHFSKIRSTILEAIGKNKKNKEKVKKIFKVVSRRGIMLNLTEEKLKIS